MLDRFREAWYGTRPCIRPIRVPESLRCRSAGARVPKVARSMSAVDMTVEVQAIPAEGAAFAWSCSAAALDIAEDVVHLSAPVTVQAQVARNGREVRVHGDITAQFQLTCVRCLVVFEREHRLTLDTVYLPGGAEGGTSVRTARLETDVDLAAYDGVRIDVRPEIRDVVLLSVPMSPHCRDDCRGLCSRCGTDLNAGPCGCPPEPSASPFAGLSELKAKLAADERKDP